MAVLLLTQPNTATGVPIGAVWGQATPHAPARPKDARLLPSAP
jgi:hypothetical protein